MATPRISEMFGPSPLELAALCDWIGRELTDTGTRAGALEAVSRLAVTRVPGADRGSITERRRNRFATVAATDDTARALDAIQYDARTGPCVEAILRDTSCRISDLDGDGRWPAPTAYGVRSVLSLPFPVIEDDARIVLNLYSERPHAFDDVAETVGALVTSHGALAVAAAAARERAENLRVALATNREIAMAVGVVMVERGLGREEALHLLRTASQNVNRKLADIAAVVLTAGTATALP